mmetsp:Transcript_43397/g.77899  ORF Transcript_43397/g.77899 Transcript_43397/m.77899 type:complete len:356 (-) Transcript_43397:43-1110(-)
MLVMLSKICCQSSRSLRHGIRQAARRPLAFGQCRQLADATVTPCNVDNVVAACVGLLRSQPETAAQDLIRSLPKDCREEFLSAAIQAAFHDKEMDRLIDGLDADAQRAVGVAALSKHFRKDFQAVFEEVDKDRSGSIDRAEFKRYLRTVLADGKSTDTGPPTTYQLMLVFLQAAIPNVIFGMLDNSIMIVGGDVVEDLIGSTFHLSTLACAALANTFADVFGISVGNSVESLTRRLGMPQPKLSQHQIKLPVVRRVNMLAGPVGILIGCVIGMTPLAFRDDMKQRLTVAFEDLDDDEDGFLSREEVVQALHHPKVGAVKASIEDLKFFKTKSADGKVDLKGFLAGYKKFSAAYTD